LHQLIDGGLESQDNQTKLRQSARNTSSITRVCSMNTRQPHISKATCTPLKACHYLRLHIKRPSGQRWPLSTTKLH